MEKFPEIISVHVGEAGCRTGLEFWETILAEHGILPNGHMIPGTSHEIYSESMLCLSPDSSLRPRTVFSDTHPAIVEEIRTGNLEHLWRSNCLLNGKESAGWNFARGYLAEGPRGLAEATTEAIRHQAECCDNLEGFLVFRGLGGGTGSALSASVLRKLKEDFCKKSRLELSFFPSEKLSSMLADAFNIVLGIHAATDYTDCCFFIDNEACYDICVQKLKLPKPSYAHINSVIAQVASGLTAIARFPKGCPGMPLADLVQTVVPNSRLHFPVTSYSPLVKGPPSAIPESVKSADELVRDALSPSSLLAPNPARPTAAAALFRGSLPPVDITECLERVKGAPLNEIPSSKLRVAVCPRPMAVPLGGTIAEAQAALTVVAASGSAATAMSRATVPARTFWGRRAYVHHYTSEGLEIDEMRTALENVEALVDDHATVFSS